MFGKFFAITSIVTLIAVSQAASVFLGFNYNQLGGFQNQIVQGSRAVIPLCFPHGLQQSDVPFNSCYREGFRGSISSRAGPCLPPIVNGKLFPPCSGPYFALSRFYR